MTADTRSYAWCNLGQLAPGESSIGDDHVQATGVCMTKGTIRLLGVVRPAAGTVVELAYSDGQNWLARIPRRLRVLSVFTNPLGTPITTVSVGCDLAYMESRKPPAANPTARDANPSVPDAVWRAATPPIPAAFVVQQILAALGITAAGSCPLTNTFTRQEFDLSEGYVQELGKLLASEGYFCRMNDAGLLEYISKDQGLQSSIVLLEDDLIEINPINTGELPAEAVFAKYSSLKLKPPNSLSEDDLKKRNWELDESISGVQEHVHSWTTYVKTAVLDANGNPTYKQSRDRDGNLLVDRNTGAPIVEQVFDVKASQIKENITYRTISRTKTQYDSWDRVALRTTETYGLYGLDLSETAYTYKVPAGGITKPSNYGDVLLERTVQYSPRGPLRMQLGFQGSFYDVTLGSNFPYLASTREVTYEKNDYLGISKTVTTNLSTYITTTHGSDAISRLRDAGESIDAMLTVATRMVDGGSETRIRTEREYGLQRRPAEAERLATANQKAPTVETTSSFTWQMGSPASLTSVELSPPYAPDDRIVWNGGSSYSVIDGGAAQKALSYARIENRLRLGHRNGLGLQLLPEHVPPQPFGLIYLRLAGCTAAYRLNGTTYTINPEGCVATTDALFWGGIDGDGGLPWFLMPDYGSLSAPVLIATNPNPRPADAIAIPQGFNPQAPNLTSLFASLPTGQAPTWGRAINPSTLLRPYRETVDLAAGIGAGATIEPQPWIPQPPVDLLAGIGAGAMMSTRLLAGIGAGALLEVQGQQAGMAPLLTALPGSTVILDSSNLEGSSGTPAWGPYFNPQTIWVVFNLTQALTIVAVGFYDHGQNGLSTAHKFSLYDENASPLTLNYGSGVQEITIPAGTAATLEGSYRVVPLSTPQTLPAGSYFMSATMPTTGADAIASFAVGTGISTWNAAVANATNIGTPAGFETEYNPANSPQVIESYESFIQFMRLGGQHCVPIGPMLFVGT